MPFTKGSLSLVSLFVIAKGEPKPVINSYLSPFCGSAYVFPKVKVNRPSFKFQGLSNCLSLSLSSIGVRASVLMSSLAIAKNKSANTIEKAATRAGPQSASLFLTLNQRLTFQYSIQRLLTPVRRSA